MVKTLVRYLKRKYKKTTKRHKHYEKFRRMKHTTNKIHRGRSRKGGDPRFTTLKNEIKALLPTPINMKTFEMDIRSDKLNGEAITSTYFNNFEKIYKMWSNLWTGLNDTEKREFEKFFTSVNVFMGHGERKPVYESVLRDLKAHHKCTLAMAVFDASSSKWPTWSNCLQKLPDRGLSTNLLQYYAKLDRDNAFKNLKAREDQLQAERNTQTDPPAAAEAPAADEAKTDAARVHLGAGLSRTPVFRSKKARNTRRLLRKHG